ncbi:MAG: hydantoinase/oxoprolinase family protein [Porticoccaceae bacterium]
MTSPLLLGVDTGGTFTDFILLRDGEIYLHKVLSTPDAPERAILQGLQDMGIGDKLDRVKIIHGTTVATNAALESKGVRTAYITNRGLGDVLTIGRQARAELYNLQPELIPPPVPPELCLETGGRMDADGNILEPLTDEDLQELVEQIKRHKPQAVAINLLFSYIDDYFEKQLEAAIQPLAYVCRSSAVLPEIREYERGIVTWYNAYLGPLVASYFRQLHSALNPAPISIMQSSGGTIAIDQAADKAANLLLSGPAGGLAAAEYLGKLIHSEKMLSFDMGGTSTDVALLDKGIRLTSEGRIGRYPIALPMVDMHTIGAGGGSIAYLDSAGMLHVGPESAGARPGPACYGQGGDRPTVTDANAVMGRIQPDSFLGGKMNLDKDRAVEAIGTLANKLGIQTEECAQGILDLANEHMCRALRVISEQRGHNPAEYQLLGFGGAGGLHICALADSMGMNRAVVPIFGGVFSALGMLAAARGRELSQSWLKLLSEADEKAIDRHFKVLKTQANRELQAEGAPLEAIEIERTVDCRYKGQSFTLNLEWQGRENTLSGFHELHLSTYGHNFDMGVELVNLRVSARVQQQSIELPTIEEPGMGRVPVFTKIWSRNLRAELEEMDSQVLMREQMPTGQWLPGPLLICETIATTWVDPHWQCMRDTYGNLLLEKTLG